MAEPARHLRAVDGEVAPDDRSYSELLFENNLLHRKLGGALSQVGKLEAELAGVRELEPESKDIRELLEFYNEFSGRRVAIDADSDRWRNTRVRLKQFTKIMKDPAAAKDYLKRAIIGAPRHDYLGKKIDRMDPKALFAKMDWVEECAALAGKPSRPRQLVSALSPIEAAAHCLAREFGLDAIMWQTDESPERRSLREVWGPCPLHPFSPPMPLRIRERAEQGSLEFRCGQRCPPEDAHEALRVLYGLQAQRQPQDEIASLRVLLAERERVLRMYGDPGAWQKGLFDRDGGALAREALRETA